LKGPKKGRCRLPPKSVWFGEFEVPISAVAGSS
jgi:hypothetical protein